MKNKTFFFNGDNLKDINKHLGADVHILDDENNYAYTKCGSVLHKHVNGWWYLDNDKGNQQDAVCKTIVLKKGNMYIDEKGNES